MPEISRFFGIVIAIYYNDHAPPHFHAVYGEHRGRIEIASGRMLDGDLPRRAIALVDEWRRLHVNELMEDWELAQKRRPLNRIEPLK